VLWRFIISLRPLVSLRTVFERLSSSSLCNAIRFPWTTGPKPWYYIRLIDKGGFGTVHEVASLFGDMAYSCFVRREIKWLDKFSFSSSINRTMLFAQKPSRDVARSELLKEIKIKEKLYSQEYWAHLIEILSTNGSHCLPITTWTWNYAIWPRRLDS